MHVWTPIVNLPVLVDSASTITLPEPTLLYSLDVNALNYCRFSLFVLTGHQSQVRALLAVPNLIESSLVRHYLTFESSSIHNFRR
jgi:ASTRA-associated protein 1